MSADHTSYTLSELKDQIIVVAVNQVCIMSASEPNKTVMLTTTDGHTLGLFFVAYQNLPGRCLVCKHGSHVINISKVDWSSVKNNHLTATPCC